MRRQQSSPVRSAGFAAGVVMAALLCGACASSKSGGGEDNPVAAKNQQGLDKYMADPLDPNVVTYGEDGTVTGGKRSQFEGKKQVAFDGEWGGKRLENKQYEKTWWGGKREKAKQEYAGNQDGSRFRAESLMMGASASQSDKRSVYDGKQSATGVYAAGAATESGRGDLARPSDARTDWRRSVYPQPKITGYKQQQEMEIEETRRMLGRE